MWLPKIDADLTVDLPGERLRASVRRIVDEDTVIVELTSGPMAKTHTYRKGDLIAVRRTAAPFNQEMWTVVEERRAFIPPELEKTNAPRTRKQRASKKRKHSRVNGKRKAAKASGRNRAVKRAPPPKSKRRTRAAAHG